MNNLKYLRNELDISIRELADYTGIANPVICYLENETRPFRQKHIDVLCAFFNVSSDYLTGRSDTGILVYKEDEEDREIILSESEYKKLQTDITTEIIKLSDEQLTFKIGKENVVLPQWTVYRELKTDSKSLDVNEVLYNKLVSLTKSMNNNELTKTIKFIEEYIINK